MRNNPTTITTETVAESIVNGQNAVHGSGNGVDSVDKVKHRLDRIAQLRGVAKDHVRSGEAAELIYEYEDRQTRGVYELEDIAEAKEAVLL